MKNTKLIALVAVLVVITLVVSIVVATNNDKKVASQLEQQVKDYESEIAQLNKTLDEFKAGLITATEALEALKEANIKLENWDKASDVMINKIAELEKALADFKASKVVYKEDGKTVLVSFNDQYNFTYAYGHNYQTATTAPETVTYHAAQFNELLELAKLDIYRAASIEDMNAIISNFKKDIAKVQTIRELLLSTLEKVNKGGVTYDDYNDLVLASYLYNVIKVTNPAMFNAPVSEDDKGEQVELAEELEALKEEFKPLVVANFIKLVDALPAKALLAPTHFDAVTRAREEQAFVLYLYGAKDEAGLRKDKWERETTYARTDAALKVLEARVDFIKTSIIPGANTINALLDTYKEYDFIANRASRDVIVNIEKKIAGWEKLNVIITDPKDYEWNEELYNLVNRDVLAGYEAKLQANVADLKADAEEFIATVETLGVITHNSKDVLAAVEASYWTYSSKCVAQLLSVADADYVIGYDLGEGVVAAWNNLATCKATYTAIMNKIAEIETAITGITKLVCVQTVHHAVDPATGAAVTVPTCNCTDAMKQRVLDETTYTLGGATMDATLANIETLIVDLLNYKGEDETGINPDLLALYKTARIGHFVANAKANVVAAKATQVAAGYDVALANEVEKVLLAEIDRRALVNYTFTVACQTEHKDPVTGKTLACDCTRLPLVTDATTKSLLDFTVSYCEGMFVKEQAAQ